MIGCDYCGEARWAVEWWSRFPRGFNGNQRGNVCARCSEFLRQQACGLFTLNTSYQHKSSHEEEK